MAKARKITAEEAMADLKKRKHHVDQTDASAMVKKFQSFRKKLAKAKAEGGELPAKTPDLPIAVTYNKKAIQALLKQPGCAGLRIFPAIKEDTVTFVLVAVDENGENIAGASAMAKGGGGGGTNVDEGQQSPPYPAPTI